MALDIPTMTFEIWTLICVFQALSLAKSALASNANELSQSDITALALSNVVAARAIGSTNPLRDTILVALVSGYALRNNHSAGAITIHSTSLQLMSSFTTVLSGLVPLLGSRLRSLSWRIVPVSLDYLDLYPTMSWQLVRVMERLRCL
jgi:hypothetical protein